MSVSDSRNTSQINSPFSASKGRAQPLLSYCNHAGYRLFPSILGSFIGPITDPQLDPSGSWSSPRLFSSRFLVPILTLGARADRPLTHFRRNANSIRYSKKHNSRCVRRRAAYPSIIRWLHEKDPARCIRAENIKLFSGAATYWLMVGSCVRGSPSRR